MTEELGLRLVKSKSASSWIYTIQSKIPGQVKVVSVWTVLTGPSTLDKCCVLCLELTCIGHGTVMLWSHLSLELVFLCSVCDSCRQQQSMSCQVAVNFPPPISHPNDNFCQTSKGTTCPKSTIFIAPNRQNNTLTQSLSQSFVSYTTFTPLLPPEKNKNLVSNTDILTQAIILPLPLCPPVIKADRIAWLSYFCFSTVVQCLELSALFQTKESCEQSCGR